MAIHLDELVERIHKALVHDVYETNDITTLMEIALRQKDELAQAQADIARSTDALKTAGEHIGKLESLEPMTHLVQYTEENA